ncbi:hypothetical protein [Burkholderia sp. 22PA0106]|uniref:hypothetical protein n=1 Tax=Burkholderia sp. 22PA0106 TaxID=3237371 RepID=UPI0039C3FD4F
MSDLGLTKINGPPGAAKSGDRICGISFRFVAKQRDGVKPESAGKACRRRICRGHAGAQRRAGSVFSKRIDRFGGGPICCVMGTFAANALWLKRRGPSYKMPRLLL